MMISLERVLKYLLLSLVFLVSCGGELPENCGDGMLQSNEVCEINMKKACSDDFTNGLSGNGMMYCNDCHSWDIQECLEEGRE